MNKSEKLKHCSGCEQNFYNGNNPYGVKECWHLQNAELIWRKQVSIDQPPPWKQKAQKLLSCFQMKRFVFVKPDQER